MKLRIVGPIRLPNPGLVPLVEERFPGGTVTELLVQLGFPASQAPFVSVLRKERRLPPTARVESTDSLTISLLVGGG